MNIVELITSPETVLGDLRGIVAARPNMVVLIVEGPTDARTYSTVFDDIHVTPACEAKNDSQGRAAVIHILGSVKEESWAHNVRGVIDRDLDIDAPTVRDNLFYTDNADLEMYAFNHNDFYRSLEECIKVEDSNSYSNLREKIYRVAAPLGAARVVAHKNSVKLPADRFEYEKTGKKAHIKDVSADESDLIAEIIAVLYRLDHKVQSQLPDLLDQSKNILFENEKILLISKKTFISVLKRVCKDEKLFRSSATQYPGETLEEQARTHIKMNPECVKNSELSRAIYSL